MYGNQAIVLIMVVFVAFLFLPVSVEAANTDVGAGMSAKFARGVSNTLTGFLELPAQTMKGAKHGFKGIDYAPLSHPLGTLAGMVTGVHHGASRTLSGISEGVGFWAADYDSNEGYGLPLDAKYAWEEGTQYSMFEPNLVEGMSPMGRKFMRGSGSALFSWMEFPGQIGVGLADGKPGEGIVNGAYFGFSRLYGGISDAVLFAAANPKDTVGYAYNREYPWDALAGKEKTQVAVKEEVAR